MSFFIKENSDFVFGTAGISESMRKSGYVCTLCIHCTEKKTGEERFVDLHLTIDQLKDLMPGAGHALFEVYADEPGTQQFGLNSCPFCGGAAEVEEHTNYNTEPFYCVACRSCTCFLGAFSTPSLAAHFWNLRTPSEQPEQDNTILTCRIYSKTGETYLTRIEQDLSEQDDSATRTLNAQ